ncbi:MAG: FAD-binding protein [Marinilabiliales bacterium]|nr:MAG: FAD-binding protein [Marinilabiliales bacterium]
MIKEIDFTFFPEQLFNRKHVIKAVSAKLGLNESDVKDYKVLRKSIDARRTARYNVRLQVITDDSVFPEEIGKFEFKEVGNSEEVLIIGAGPAGYFAALTCILSGLKPIVIERGKAVEDRKKDIALLNREHILNSNSNYSFGEGGAGTYSDGKLYTRSKKRGSVKDVLQLLHLFGADRSVLVDAHPHIGTDKLPNIMKNIREKILSCGGEIHFNTKVESIVISQASVKYVKCSDSKEFDAKNVVLATGHSARDIYFMLDSTGVEMQAKGFAMGVRVEHPQGLIYSIQYKRKTRGEFLPAATYSLVQQINERGVYSFCMCPGGTIVCAATGENEIVVNGMSNSKLNGEYANSGIVVEIRPEDIEANKTSKFGGIEFQQQLERLTYQNSASVLSAPAQRLEDFVKGKISKGLPQSTYYTGLINSPMHFWLPENIGSRLRPAFKAFDKKMRGFLTNEALVVGVESRTSSPVQIIRDKETFESVSVKGLYPCGEGAGYAGGIVSSAIDGIQVVNRIAGK